MTPATKLLRTAIAIDKTTSSGRTAVRMLRGKYERLFRSNSTELQNSALRTFDRLVRK